MRILADECCPRVMVDRLRQDGHDVRYAAETDRRAADADLLALANQEGRALLTEDFDFGELIVRQRRSAIGVVIVHLPKSAPVERAERVARIFAAPDVVLEGMLSIVTPRRVRQRRIG